MWSQCIVDSIIILLSFNSAEVFTQRGRPKHTQLHLPSYYRNRYQYLYVCCSSTCVQSFPHSWLVNFTAAPAPDLESSGPDNSGAMISNSLLTYAYIKGIFFFSMFPTHFQSRNQIVQTKI